jgi:DNA-binding transcriptional LysR family regulator
MADEMELRHLRYFLAVADTENVSRAALKLHVSQPALSRQIRDLEEELGFLLLERSAKSVRLTDAGKTFQAEVRAVLQRLDEAVKTTRAVATGGRSDLHVGFAPSLTVRILPPSLRAFQAASPTVRVLLHDLSTEEMLAQLREAKLQIAFLVRPTEAMLRGLRFEEVLRDLLCLAVAPKHHLARRRFVRLAELTREPLIAYNRKEYPEYHAFLAELFDTIESKPVIGEECEGLASLVAAVEAGGGVALVPRSMVCLVGPRLKLIPITPAPKPLVIGAAWPERGLEPAAERFLKCAREAAEQLQVPG